MLELTRPVAPYNEEEEEGPPTPRAQSSAGSYHIAATVLEEPPEELDPRKYHKWPRKAHDSEADAQKSGYQVEPSMRFQPGEV